MTNPGGSVTNPESCGAGGRGDAVDDVLERKILSLFMFTFGCFVCISFTASIRNLGAEERCADSPRSVELPSVVGRGKIAEYHTQAFSQSQRCVLVRVKSPRHGMPSYDVWQQSGDSSMGHFPDPTGGIFS